MTALLVWLAACNPPLQFDSSGPDPDTGDPDSGDSAGPDSADSGDSGRDTSVPTDDLDGDGYTVEDGDCDDDDPSRSPGAPESLDGEDQDCDGVSDAGGIDAWAGAASTAGDGLGFGSTIAVSRDSAGLASEYVAIGAPVGAVGAAYVFDVEDFATGTTAGAARYTLTGPADGAVGAALLFERLDADTYADLLAGDPSWNGGVGSLHVLDGARIRTGGAGTADGATRTVEGPPLVSSAFGRSVAVAGGIAFVGAPEGAADMAFFAFDASELARGTYSTAADGGRVSGAELGLGAGMIAMDWDSDGADDLVVTASHATGDGLALGAGGAYVWLADDLLALSDGGDTGSSTAQVKGGVARAFLGYPFAGDFDGDGADELVLASRATDTLADRSVIVVATESGEIVSGDASFSVSGLQVPTSDGPGVGVADVDGDGVDELLVGDFGNSPGQLLVFGYAGATLAGVLEPSDAAAMIDGPALFDEFGATVAALSDEDTAAEDLLVGAPSYEDGAVFFVPTGF